LGSLSAGVFIQASEFSSLQLIVPDAKDAADGTDKFMMTVGFGELINPAGASIPSTPVRH
jgi:hypothetical protein